ncbi:class I SAM-dependent methyltransferase [Methanocella sp. MCL-LM]|uniref:class I SAM-dependent methyltransferase n=1 Tax=Methanocella sp. MCL-LM TaxID=3412035 RepID=UPI003C767549
MVTSKEKVRLAEAQETLLIPLYSKAVMGKRHNSIFSDPKAEEILGRVEYDFSRLKIPEKTNVMMCMRAKKLDAYAREFLARNPEAVVLHLGCGLDSRCVRVDRGESEWYDLDMPDVIALRRKFYEESGRYHLIPSSVTDLQWVDSVKAQGRPVLVIAEGLLMYLKAEEVKALILKLREAFPGCEMAFDAFSMQTVRRMSQHPSIKSTGATIYWGIDDAQDIEKWADGIRLKEEWYFTDSEDIDKLGLVYRLSFRLAGLFSMARKAQRILYYSL